MLRDYFGGTTETLILIPKKNGKSTLLAALSLFHLVSTPDAECVIAAASRDQASILFRQAVGFINRTDGLRARLDPKGGYREIRRLGDGGRLRVLASDADTADGVIPTLALVDELHRHKSADLYGVFRDGLGPRNGRMITISTAGDDELSPLGVMRRAALQLPGVERTGSHTYAKSTDGGYVMHEWALSKDDDLHDLDLVAEANPAPWQDREALRRRHDSPSMTPWQWARFACGVWTQDEHAWLPAGAWDALAAPGVEIPDGSRVWVGVDIGLKYDRSAVVVCWPRDDGKVVVKATVFDLRRGQRNKLADNIAAGGSRLDLERVEVPPRLEVPEDGLEKLVAGLLSVRLLAQEPELPGIRGVGALASLAARDRDRQRPGAGRDDANRCEHRDQPKARLDAHALAAVGRAATKGIPQPVLRLAEC